MSIRSVEFVALKIQELPSTQVERYLAAYVRAVRIDEVRLCLRAIARIRPLSGGEVRAIDAVDDHLTLLQRRAK